MRSIASPNTDGADLARHKEAHYRMRKLIHAVRKLHATRPDWVDEEKFLGFLKDWLAHVNLRRRHEIRPLSQGRPAGARGRAAAARERSGSGGVQDEAAHKPYSALADDGALTVKVPHDNVKIIRRCARLLDEGGVESQTLTEIADPITGMSILEAQEIAKPLMH